MATRKTALKSKKETEASEQPKEVTLEQALKEGGEGRTPETINSSEKKSAWINSGRQLS